MKILKYTPVNDGKKIGYVDVEIDTDKGPIYMKRLVHVKTDRGEWINFPSYKDASTAFGNADTPQYSPFMGFSIDATNKAFLQAVAREIKPYVAKSTTPTSSVGPGYADASGRGEVEENLPF